MLYPYTAIWTNSTEWRNSCCRALSAHRFRFSSVLSPWLQLSVALSPQIPALGRSQPIDPLVSPCVGMLWMLCSKLHVQRTQIGLAVRAKVNYQYAVNARPIVNQYAINTQSIDRPCVADTQSACNQEAYSQYKVNMQIRCTLGVPGSTWGEGHGSWSGSSSSVLGRLLTCYWPVCLPAIDCLFRVCRLPTNLLIDLLLSDYWLLTIDYWLLTTDYWLLTND